MPVTTGQVNKALKRGFFEPDKIYLSDLSNGQFHGTELGTNESGVIGYLQVGQDAPVDDDVAVIVGQYQHPDPRRPDHMTGVDAGDKFLTGQTDHARPDIDIQDDADNDITDDTSTGKVAVVGAKQPEDTKPRTAFGWRRVDRIDTNLAGVDITEISPVTPSPQNPMVIGDGEYVNLVFNPGSNAAATVGLGHSSGYFPVLTWDGSGL